MKLRQTFLGGLKKKAKSFSEHGKAFIVILVLGVLIIGKIDLNPLRVYLLEIYFFILEPIKEFKTIFYREYIDRIEHLTLDNINLSTELKRLEYIKIENTKIKDIANYQGDIDYHKILARVFFLVGDSNRYSMFLNIGSDNGVKEYSIVVNQAGLVGLITEVSKSWSRAIYVFNRLFKVPVILINSNIEAIVSGSQDGAIFEIFSEEKTIKAGDIAVTSGKCGYFPPGIVVGFEQNGILVPFVKPEQTDYVVILVKKKEDFHLVPVEGLEPPRQ